MELTRPLRDAGRFYGMQLFVTDELPTGHFMIVSTICRYCKKRAYVNQSCMDAENLGKPHVPDNALIISETDHGKEKETQQHDT